jgi:nucleoside-diphosphate-sugar epimerase
MAAMTYTVFGSGGFIGGELVNSLKLAGEIVYTPDRDDIGVLRSTIRNHSHGHVFYCIGLTANFRTRPFDTVQAHVCVLREFLERAQFETFTYLSSTRVYQGVDHTSETAALRVTPHEPSDLYNLSKLMGESLCHARGTNTKVVRLSNVYGAAMPPQNFLSQVLHESRVTGQVQIRSAPLSSKDYVSIEDVVRLLPMIATFGKHPVYNVATGRNTSNAHIGSLLQQRGVRVSFAEDAPVRSFPIIDTSRLNEEFGVSMSSLCEDLDRLFDS